MSGLIVYVPIILDVDLIRESHAYQYVSEDKELQGKYMLEVGYKSNKLNFLCDDEEEMKDLYTTILKAKPFVNINEIRGK